MKKWLKVFIVLLLLIIAIYMVDNVDKIIKRDNVNNIDQNDDEIIKNKEDKLKENKKYNEEIEVVGTLLDKIEKNTVWCGTFQLVWNDMQDEVIKRDIVFENQIELVENLNKQTFKEKDLSEEYYYKKWGLMTFDLKDEIENGIQEKFEESSDVLDLIDWSDVPQDDSGYKNGYEKYLFYVMLFREFNFKNEFDELENDIFEGSEKIHEDIEYFGINKDSSEKLYSQVDVLYYNSEDDCAVILNTKEGDEIFLVKGDNGNNFLDIYDTVLDKKEDYDGKNEFTENDILKVPDLDFNILKKYEELIGNSFLDSEGNECEIKEALQTIEMSLDKSGGKIKSEAVIVTDKVTAIIPSEEVEYRYFEFDSEFTIFLRESGKDLPYFAANINDITLFQESSK